MSTYTICTIHNQTTIIGPGTDLAELECPTCLAILDRVIPAPAPTDPEELFVSRITQHANGNCCCHTCDPDFCYECGHYYDFCICQNQSESENESKHDLTEHQSHEVPF